MDFKVKFKRGKPIQVVHAANPKPFGKGFTYTAIPVKCKQGREQILSQVPKALKVSKKGKFSYKLNLPQHTPQGNYVNKLRIAGKFVSKRKAKGTLWFQGVLYMRRACSGPTARAASSTGRPSADMGGGDRDVAERAGRGCVRPVRVPRADVSAGGRATRR